VNPRLLSPPLLCTTAHRVRPLPQLPFGAPPLQPTVLKSSSACHSCGLQNSSPHWRSPMPAGCSSSTVSLPCWISRLQSGLSIKSTLSSSSHGNQVRRDPSASFHLLLQIKLWRGKGWWLPDLKMDAGLPSHRYHEYSPPNNALSWHHDSYWGMIPISPLFPGILESICIFWCTGFIFLRGVKTFYFSFEIWLTTLGNIWAYSHILLSPCYSIFI
jgi:hypothetical protein